MYIRQGDVERRALQVARGDFILDEVDHHLALGRHGHSRENRLSRCALERRGVGYIRVTSGLHIARIAVDGDGCHVLQGEALGVHTVDGGVFLERIVPHQPVRIDLCGVDGVVHIAQEPVFGERGFPYTHLIDVGILRVLGEDECRAAEVRYIRFGEDRRARPVHVERSRLSPYHIEGEMMPAGG